MGADDAPARADVGEHLQALLDVLAAAADRLERLESSGSSTKIRSISSSIVAVRIAIASVLGSSGANAGSVGLRTERTVHLAGDDAEGVHLGEERLGVAGERVEREVPAVGRARQVLL